MSPNTTPNAEMPSAERLAAFTGRAIALLEQDSKRLNQSGDSPI
jgi:hypothetical protein